MNKILLTLIKKLLFRMTRKDFLVLNENWSATSLSEGFALFSSNKKDKIYLPVRYDYHVLSPWEIKYNIRGSQKGVLHYKLGIPDSKPFLDLKIDVELPFLLVVTLEDRGIVVNGELIVKNENQLVDTYAPMLTGEFNFLCDQGQTLYRRTAHRIQLEEREADSEYFNGLVYSSYDTEAIFVAQSVFETLKNYHLLSGKMLDVGCATGLLVEYASKQGLEAEGVDYSPWAIEKANIRTHNKCRVLNLDNATIKDFSTSYDIITLHSVLEHFADPLAALRLLFEVCEPNGVVYIQTLNAASLMHLIMGRDWAGYTDYTHKSPWITADWLIEMAADIGFEVSYVKRYYVWNDNVYDDVWRSFSSFASIYPANVILEDQFGDAFEAILRRPVKLPYVQTIKE